MAKVIKKYSKVVLIFGLILALTGVYIFWTPGSVKAGVTTLESDTITDSRPSTVADHLIYFKTPSGVTSTDSTIILDFDNSFTIGSVDNTDVDLATSTATSNCPGATYAEAGIAGTADASNWGVATSAGTIFTFTPPTDTTAASLLVNTCVRIKIGLNATGGNAQLTNPGTVASYSIDISGAFGDTGSMKVAIIGGVTVSATISETLTATVNGTTTAECPILLGTEVNTTTTTVPFGAVNADTFYDGCQVLNVGTNAANGYTTTVYKTQLLTSAGATIADGNCDGLCTATGPGAWGTADNNGFGYCMADYQRDGAKTATSTWATYYCGAGTQNFMLIGTGSANAQNIMKSNSATSTNKAFIGYRLSVDSSQAAGSYETTIVYIVTPTY